MHVHAQAMNEYCEVEMSMEVEHRPKFCGRKLWTIEGSESVLTTPPCFGLTKVQIIFDVAAISKWKDQE